MQLQQQPQPNRVSKNIHYIKVLNTCNKNMRRAIIENSSKELIHTICECVLNCINGNVHVNDNNKKLLRKHRRKIHELLRKRRSSLKQKKRILIQQGSSFLPIILSTILSAIGSQIFNS